MNRNWIVVGDADREAAAGGGQVVARVLRQRALLVAGRTTRRTGRMVNAAVGTNSPASTPLSTRLLLMSESVPTYR
jgi:hypothetical protein